MTGNEQNQQTELLAVPGWGTPFPPEQPRRDADEEAPNAGMPTAASVAAASASGEEAQADFTHEDRRPFDRRRRKARGIDNLLLLPVAFGVVKLTGGVSIAAALLVLAVEMSYFFVMETLQGQTIGKRVAKLRVMHPDGSAAGAGRIALRTVLRPIDYTLVGIVTVLATGKKRQRLGDLAANTIVRDDNRIFRRAPESPLLVVFPLLWIGAAVAAMVALKPVDPMLARRNPDPYMTKIDKICEKQARQSDALNQSGAFNLTSARILYRQQGRKIEKLPKAPPEVAGEVKEVVRYHRQLNAMLDRMIRDMNRSATPAEVLAQQSPAVESLIATARTRYQELGLPYCAKSGSAS